MNNKLFAILLLLGILAGCCACSRDPGTSASPSDTAVPADIQESSDSGSPSASVPAQASDPDSYNGSPVMTMGTCALLAEYNPYALLLPADSDPARTVILQIGSGAAEDVLTGDKSSFAVQKDDGSGWHTVCDAITDDNSLTVRPETQVFQTLDCGDTFDVNGDGHYRIIKQITVQGEKLYYTSDFYVLRHSDPKVLQKSTYKINPRKELALSVRYPSVTLDGGSNIAPGYVDLSLSLLMDTGIDPICGNSADCIIEELIDGEWYTVPRPDYFMTLEGYTPTLTDPVRQTFFLGGTVQHPGHYRLLKPVIIGRGSAIVHEYYAAEFDVTKEPPAAD